MRLISHPRKARTTPLSEAAAEGSSPPVLCRPALPQDEEEALTFLDAAWEGEDYVPERWAEWMWEEPGLLAVALRQGQVVGLGHLLDMGEGEAWLEGLRVHPDRRSQGIGSHLHDYFVAQWEHSGLGVVRLATHLERDAVHAMCARTAFERRFMCVLASGQPLSDSGPTLTEMDPGSLQDWIDRLRQSERLHALSGLIDYGWRFAEPSYERLRRLHDLVLLEPEGLPGQIAVRERIPSRVEAHVVVMAVPSQHLIAVLEAARRWIFQRGMERLNWLAPKAGEIAGLAEAAGYAFDPAQTLVIYERRR